MKKLMYTGVIALGLGLMSFKKTNCYAYALTACQEETLHYGPMSQSEFNSAFNWYVSACNEAGGEIQEPVFL